MGRLTATQRLGAFAADLTYDALPPAVRAKGALCVLDGVANALGGHDWPWSVQARRVAAITGGRGPATLWGTTETSAVAEAIFANTVAAHSILHEDMHMHSQSHFGTMVVPAVLAQSEAMRASGRDLLTALITGYEIGGRIGKAIVGDHFNQGGYRPSGTFGALATAAAVGKLLALSSDEMTNALGMAANLGVGLNEWANAGTMELYFQNAFAARNGFVAAHLAREGVRTAPEMIEGPAGFANAFAGGPVDVERVLADLGREWEMFNVYHKPAPACAYLQSVIQAAQRLVRRTRMAADDIVSVTIRTFPLGKQCPGVDNPGPFEEIIQAQMSNQFVVAAVLLDGELTLDHLLDCGSKAIARLAPRIHVVVDEQATRVFPGKKAGGLRVTLEGGRVEEEWVEDLAYPTDDDVTRKFHTYARRVFAGARADRLYEAILGLESIEDATALGALLRRGAAE